VKGIAGMREAKTPQMIELELRQKRPIESIITDSIQECGSARAAALKLGVNPATFFGWMVRLGIRTKLTAYIAN
jgi:hypothetical protein